jgi:hypothetical protein
MKKILSIILFVMIFTQLNAQPFSLKSTGNGKGFQLDIYYGSEGKGAFVQYRGHQGTIPLKIVSRVMQGNPESSQFSYIWDEVVDGKVTGSYGLTQKAKTISGAWYKRKKDGQRFDLENAAANMSNSTGKAKYLLHGILISFYQSANDELTFSYPSGHTQTIHLPDFDHPDPLRKGNIADYNFDGYDDVAFSIPDAGMGVYRTFSIFLYDPLSKRFKQLSEPSDQRANCSGFCDVTLDKKNKLFFTSCRGAATWWKDTYRFSKAGKLIWVSSGKQQ